MDEEPRMTLEPEGDLPPTIRIRYIFTVVLKPKTLPDDPLSQKIFLDDMLSKLTALDSDRVGVTAVVIKEGE